MMKVEAYRITEQRSLEVIDPGTAFDTTVSSDLLFWINVEQPVSDRMQELLSPLKLHPLVLDICLDPVPNSSVTPLPGSLVVRFPLSQDWDDVDVAVISIICLPQCIITIHEQSNHILERLSSEFAGDRQLHDTTTSAILYQILDSVIDRDMEFMLNVRRRVDELEELVEQDSNSDLIREVLTFKRRVARFVTFIEDQHRCANTLQTLESKYFSIVGLQEYMRDTISHSEHALRSVNRQEGRLNELYQHYQLSLHDKADNRLRILTIISAVFMPLSLITGIYGMNFQQMPELDWPWAYPAVVSLMLILAGGMLWNFYRRGWFQ